jgi:hypothetical protein
MVGAIRRSSLKAAKPLECGGPDATLLVFLVSPVNQMELESDFL